MARVEEGLKNEALRQALHTALAGDTARLEELLVRHGTLPSARPNLTLAAAFGIELSAHTEGVPRLLHKLGADDTPAEPARAFLPVAAAHGWAARLREGADDPEAWEALAGLAADERVSVRLGILDALVTLALRPGLAARFVEQARGWLSLEDREVRFGATALAFEVVGEPRIISAIPDLEALLEYLSEALSTVADAPRSAERSEGRRRLLLSLPRTLANVAVGVRAGGRGLAWLEAECERTKHPDLRRALSLVTEQLRTGGRVQGDVAERLKQTLEASAKPLRDPSRVRPGTGRGKSSRRTR